MKFKDFIIVIIALVLAYFIIQTLWYLMFFAIKIAAVLIVAYALYLFLKKVL